MRVTIPSPLLHYTGQRAVSATGDTLAAVLLDLDRQFPGVRFRMVDEQEQIRTHMRVFLDRQELHALSAPMPAGATLHIVQALSGG